MALSREEQTKIKIEELGNLRRAMGQFQGERLAKLKRGPVAPPEDAPEEADAAEAEGEDSGDEEQPVVEMAPCPECGKDVEAGAGECPHCGAQMTEDEGGEGGDDTDRLAALAKARNDRK